MPTHSVQGGAVYICDFVLPRSHDEAVPAILCACSSLLSHHSSTASVAVWRPQDRPVQRCLPEFPGGHQGQPQMEWPPGELCQKKAAFTIEGSQPGLSPHLPVVPSLSCQPQWGRSRGQQQRQQAEAPCGLLCGFLRTLLPSLIPFLGYLLPRQCWS